MKIIKGQTVMLITGKDKGKTGKVAKVLLKNNKIVIEGLNLKKKQIKPRKQGEKGQIINIPSPVAVSNVMAVCKNCGKPSRMGYKMLNNETKIKVCKKCGGEL